VYIYLEKVLKNTLHNSYWSQNLKSTKDILGNKDNAHQFLLSFSVKWLPRTGPVIFVAWRNSKVGLALFCHRREDRCFKVFGYPTFLCARCLGLFLGTLITPFLLLFNVNVPLLLAGLMIIPLLIDGFSQLLRLRESNNSLRLLTGIFFSVGFFTLVYRVG
jgi:uncharacterized membrane protein